VEYKVKLLTDSVACCCAHASNRMNFILLYSATLLSNSAVEIRVFK